MIISKWFLSNTKLILAFCAYISQHYWSHHYFFIICSWNNIKNMRKCIKSSLLLISLISGKFFLFEKFCNNFIAEFVMYMEKSVHYQLYMKWSWHFRHWKVAVTQTLNLCQLLTHMVSSCGKHKQAKSGKHKQANSGKHIDLNY